MKRMILSILILLFVAASLTACDKQQDSHHTEQTNLQEDKQSDKQEGKTDQNDVDHTLADKNSNETEEDMGVNPKLKVGDKAPAWKLESDNAGVVDSESLKGQKYILYFYPKNMTKGCTLEAIDFQNHQKDFADKGYKVYGVSTDSLESHGEFREQNDLEFTLLSDPDHSVADAYGVWREKNVYGKTSVGMVRSTFVIDEEGNLTQVLDNVKATGHVERLLSSL